MTPTQYTARLVKQGHGVPVSLIRGVPVLLGDGELASGEDNVFIRWVHKSRRLSSMVALRPSIDKADVPIERKFVITSPN